ncbi:tRNA (guanine(9)-N(1))-methyltransferase [Paecilomyces lecythidis]|uniref:tRNA (guanine(9)-N1)-methyltransferase n=1 Tax=Paecilomyces lecythidis TaxID=3004212 RepID=A0ABR3X9C9_9EURO
MAMEEEERPRKIQKMDRDEPQSSPVDAELGPVMTGAVVAGENDTASEDESRTGTPATDNKDATSDTNNGLADIPGATPGMSKNQLKKLRRKQQWEAERDSRRAKRKEKLIAKRERKRAAAIEAAQSGAPKPEPKLKLKHLRSTLLPITFVLDCGYDELMLDKERISLASQLTRSYSDNHRSPYRSHLVVSSFDKLLKERFETVLSKSHLNWKGVRFFEEDFAYAAEKAKEWMQGPEGGKLDGVLAKQTDMKPEDGEVIYLSSDSPDTLTELKPYSTYIIGGLVDKNRHKGICYKTAVEKGIKTAKLPIGEYIQMASRSVLATNHVVEIMLRWLELGDWGEAFMRVIPKRKGGVLKGEGNKSEEGNDTPENDQPEETVDQEQPAAEQTAESNGEGNS